jgi:hypothetical protein
MGAGDPLPKPLPHGSTRSETWALRRDALLREQAGLLEQLVRGPRRPRSDAASTSTGRTPGCCSFCEPGSTLEQPTITEAANYRRFVVAQADAERQRRLRRHRGGPDEVPGSSADTQPR